MVLFRTHNLKYFYFFKISSEYVIRSYIARIKQVNPILNAIVQDRFAEAITEAQNVDKLISSKKISVEELKISKPLLGLPVTVKESIAVKGMSNRAGSLFNNKIKSEIDATAITQVKNAGAIPLLVSNTPELCMNWETVNNITGRTCNPYDSRRTSGGSSGGEVRS